MSLNLHGIISTLSFSGRNGAGSISIPGLVVGDSVLFAVESNGAAVAGSDQSWFEGAVSVADEIQQDSGADLSGSTFTLIVFRA